MLDVTHDDDDLSAIEVNDIDYVVGDDVAFRTEPRTNVGKVLGFVSYTDDPDDIDVIYMFLKPDEYGNVASVGHYQHFVKFRKEFLH